MRVGGRGVGYRLVIPSPAVSNFCFSTNDNENPPKEDDADDNER